MRKAIIVLGLMALCLPVRAQRFVKVFDTLAAMQAANPNDVHTNAFLVGRSSQNDGGGGAFTYSSTSSATVNSGTIFKPNSANGRWLRSYTGNLDVRWFGAKGDGTTDDTVAIQAAIDFQHTSGGKTKIFVPAGQYKKGRVTFYANTSLIGDGREVSKFLEVDTFNTSGWLSSDETDTSVRNVAFADLDFVVGTSGTTITNVIRFKNVGYSKVDFCRFDLGSTNLNRTAIFLDGASATYYNTISGNQILNARVGIFLKDAANANVVSGNTFLVNIFPVISTNSVSTRIVGNSVQDCANGFGIWLQGPNSYRNVVENNWIEGVFHGVFMDGGAHDNRLSGNQYSGITGTDSRSFAGASEKLNDIDEISFNTLYDAGQWRQIKRAYLNPFGGDAFPATAPAYDYGMWALPETSTHNGALISQVKDKSGNRYIVPYLLPQRYQPIPAGTQAPDVFNESWLVTVNTNSTTITNFIGGYSGQNFRLLIRDNFTSIDFGSNKAIHGNVNSPYTCRDGDVFDFRLGDDGVWRTLFYPAVWGFTVSDNLGLGIRTTTGATWDFFISKPDGSGAYAYIPTGTTDFNLIGKLSVSQFENQTISAGLGDPNGSITANFGSFRLDSTGHAWLKTGNSGGNTGWEKIGVDDNWVAEGTTNSILAGIGKPWAMNVTDHVNVGTVGETGVISISSTNANYTLSLSLLANGDLSITNNGVLVDTLALNSLYAGGGTKVKTDDGTYKTLTSPPGATVTNIVINQTDGYLPYRFDSTTFKDSLFLLGNSQTGILYSGTNSVVFTLQSRDVTAQATYINGFLYDSDGSAESGLISFSKNTGWGISNPSARNAAMGFNVLHNNTLYNRMNIDGATGDVNFFDNVGNALIGLFSGTSGYSGTGNADLADDGTYKIRTNYVTLALSNPNSAVTTGNTNFWVAPEAVTIKTVTAHLFVASSSGSVTLELKKNGTTVLSAPVSLTSGTTNATASVSVTSVSAFDRLAGEITAAGTTAYGAQLKIGYTAP